jgi:hypothetical protein
VDSTLYKTIDNHHKIWYNAVTLNKKVNSVMKTNQQMMVTIGEYVQPIEHLTMMGHLNSLWDYGNGLRAAKGLQPLLMTEWLRSQTTRELIDSIEKRYYGNFPYYELDERGRTISMPVLSCVKAKRGKGGGTWVHLYLMLDAAAWLDSDFKLDVYETFVTNRILQWRDDSGDEFIALNAAIDAYLPGREGKDNKGIFIQSAIKLKEKIHPDEGNWNTANYNQLQQRTEVERNLVKLLQLGVVRDWEHLKELIEKV